MLGLTKMGDGRQMLGARFSVENLENYFQLHRWGFRVQRAYVEACSCIVIGESYTFVLTTDEAH